MKLVCPSCAFAGDMDEFVPKKIGDWFADRAFPLLLIVVLFALLRGFGFLAVK